MLNFILGGHHVLTYTMGEESSYCQDEYASDIITSSDQNQSHVTSCSIVTNSEQAMQCYDALQQTNINIPWWRSSCIKKVLSLFTTEGHLFLLDSDSNPVNRWLKKPKEGITNKKTRSNKHSYKNQFSAVVNPNTISTAAKISYHQHYPLIHEDITSGKAAFLNDHRRRKRLQKRQQEIVDKERRRLRPKS